MIRKAIQFALIAHDKQTRKGSSIPYIFHPMEVGMILIENKACEDIVCAGILHDTVEDAKASLAMIENLFNKNIAGLVKAQSENKALCWKKRKQHTIIYMKNDATEDERLVCCADKLSNIRSIERDYKDMKDELWKRFNAGYEDQKWYYESLVDSLASLKDYDMYKEFKKRVEQVFSGM